MKSCSGFSMSPSVRVLRPERRAISMALTDVLILMSATRFAEHLSSQLGQGGQRRSFKTTTRS